MLEVVLMGTSRGGKYLNYGTHRYIEYFEALSDEEGCRQRQPSPLEIVEKNTREDYRANPIII